MHACRYECTPWKFNILKLVIWKRHLPFRDLAILGIHVIACERCMNIKYTHVCDICVCVSFNKCVHIPGTQMTLVLVGKDLVLGGWPAKIEVEIGVPGKFFNTVTIPSFAFFRTCFFPNGTDSLRRSPAICTNLRVAVILGHVHVHGLKLATVRQLFPQNVKALCFFFSGGGGGWCNETALAKGGVYFWSKYRCSAGHIC